MLPLFRISASPFSISSIEKFPPHILYTYSGVINSGSKEHDFPSLSINDCSLSSNDVSVITMNHEPLIVNHKSGITSFSQCIIRFHHINMACTRLFGYFSSCPISIPSKATRASNLSFQSLSIPAQVHIARPVNRADRLLRMAWRHVDT